MFRNGTGIKLPELEWDALYHPHISITIIIINNYYKYKNWIVSRDCSNKKHQNKGSSGGN